MKISKDTFLKSGVMISGSDKIKGGDGIKNSNKAHFVVIENDIVKRDLYDHIQSSVRETAEYFSGCRGLASALKSGGFLLLGTSKDQIWNSRRLFDMCGGKLKVCVNTPAADLTESTVGYVPFDEELWSLANSATLSDEIVKSYFKLAAWELVHTVRSAYDNDRELAYFLSQLARSKGIDPDNGSKYDNVARRCHALCWQLEDVIHDVYNTFNSFDVAKFTRYIHKYVSLDKAGNGFDPWFDVYGKAEDVVLDYHKQLKEISATAGRLARTTDFTSADAVQLTLNEFRRMVKLISDLHIEENVCKVFKPSLEAIRECVSNCAGYMRKREHFTFDSDLAKSTEIKIMYREFVNYVEKTPAKLEMWLQDAETALASLAKQAERLKRP